MTPYPNEGPRHPDQQSYLRILAIFFRQPNRANEPPVHGVTCQFQRKVELTPTNIYFQKLLPLIFIW